MSEDPNHGNGDLHSPNIDESLRQILRSSQFKESMQLQTLLKYIVEKSLEGQDDALKERIIGIEVFRRKSDYDTADDPIVRSRVGHLRKRLAQYYESQEAKGARVQIVIPNGSYRPTFVFHPEANGGSLSGPAVHQPQTSSSHRAGEWPEPKITPPAPSPLRAARLPVLGIAIAGCGVILLTIWAIVANTRKRELDLLWGPLVESKKTVILYTGTISAYLPPAANLKRSAPPGEDELPATDPSVALSDGRSADPREFVLFSDGLAPPGDILADLKVATLMNTENRNLSLRSGPNLPFVDLKGSPLVLIGAYDNHWTLNMARDLPFFFDRASRIRERNGQHRVWSSVARTDNTITEDYAVVFRLLNSKAGAPVLAIAGLTTCGTQAAAEFVTDPVQLRKLASIPRNVLDGKNLEFVLRASLVNCNPTSVDIVAQQAW
jgi:hypothetical protein